MRQDERGTSIVEMALVLPLFMLLVLGVMDFGRAIYVRNILANAARDGARFAIVDPANTTCIREAAIARGSIANLTPSSVTITRGTLVIDQPVTVTVRGEYIPLSPLIADAIGVGDRIQMQAAATMRIRNVASSPLPCP